MVARLLIVLAVVGVVFGIWLLLRARQRKRLHVLEAARPFADLVPPGRPAIVALSSPTCVECRTRQVPALERARALVGARAAIMTVSAEEYPALVAQLGILSVPATAVLDATGVVRFLNQTFADEQRLLQQLEALSAHSST